jgi:hypothetical protein
MIFGDKPKRVKQISVLPRMAGAKATALPLCFKRGVPVKPGRKILLDRRVKTFNSVARQLGRGRMPRCLQWPLQHAPLALAGSHRSTIAVNRFEPPIMKTE